MGLLCDQQEEVVAMQATDDTVTLAFSLSGTYLSKMEPTPALWALLL